MKQKIVIGLIALVVVLAGAFAWLKPERNPAEAYLTEKLTSGPLEATVTATGTINPRTSVEVGTQVSGTIQSLHADYNSSVSQGQLLAQIDPATFQAQVEQSRASLLIAQASLAKAEVDRNEAQRNLKRSRELYAKDFIAAADLDDAAAAFQNAVAQVASARAQVAQARASLSQATTNLKNTRIVSPVTGTVISRSVEVGQTVAASFSTPTLFEIAADLTKMQIDTNVDEADIGSIRVGQPVRFSVDAYPDHEFTGAVAVIRNAPTTVENVVTYDVVVDVANPELKLKPGMTANVTIVLASKPRALKCPNAALRFKPSDAKQHLAKGQGLWTFDEDGKPRRLSVVTGLSDGSHTEVSGAGLKPGLTVIVDEAGTESGSNRRMGGPGMMH